MLAWTILLPLAVGAATPVVHHEARVTLDVEAGRLDVVDTVSVPAALTGKKLRVTLHGGLQPKLEGAVAGKPSAAPPGGPFAVDVFVIPQAPATFTLRYAGKIVHPPEQAQGEYQRSFQESPGTIDARGVYLPPESLWLPQIEVEGAAALTTGAVTLAGLPAGWRALGTGDRTVEAPGGSTDSTVPSDGLHLLAGPFVERKERKGSVQVLVWLRADDAALAERYLEVTGQYLALYEELIGPYPYGKFALVENFWETGYGMPSFTLLGPQVVRFPFILHTSYPHELLHNYWGNGVFVDGGNWSEGLTAYLADHLNAEHNGKGDEHRRTALSRYGDYVTPATDFALTTFRGRSSAASEAVGYGKWMMTVHMLRRRVGDEAFKAGLQQLWREHRFDRATFQDVEAAFATASKQDLSTFFRDWTTRTGAPALRWKSVEERTNKAGARSVRVTLEQTQAEAGYELDVPVFAADTDGKSHRGVALFRGGDKTSTVEIPLPRALARVDIDPFYDTFRQLAPAEVPPSLSKTLGAQKVLFVVPTFASSEEQAAWRAFAQGLCGPEIACTTQTDEQVQALPKDASVWVLGYGNSLRASAVVAAARYGARFDDRGLMPPGTTSVKERTSGGEHAIVLAAPQPNAPRQGLVFVGAPDVASIPLLQKKLPHYGKYGWLTFHKQTADNSGKGQWDAVGSPFSVVVDASMPRRAKDAPALIALPPPFDAARMLQTVRALGDPALGGRGPKSPGLQKAEQLVEDTFKQLGLLPGGDGGTFRQCLDDASGCNVVGVLPGTKPGLPPVLLGAHLDGLGTGGANAKRGQRGKVHPGADDNASGVAVLLEVARSLARQGGGARGVVFVAFTGEEQGLLGSTRFVAQLGPGAQTRVMAALNLDTVGRRGERPLLLLDGHSATEWVHIARGVGFTTGVKVELAKDGGGASDQVPFLAAGVPAVQLFSGPTPDYHTSTDTADKVEGGSLIDAAVVAREFVAYLRDRPEPLTATLTSSTPSGAAAPAPARRASLGTVPDMAFEGPGVRIEGTTPGSPAEKLGLRPGDVLVSMDGVKLQDLKGYSDALKQKKPGDTATLVVVRGGKALTFTATLIER